MRESQQIVQTLALASAVVLLGSLSARATVDMTFSWDQTYYQAGYTADYINGSDAIGIYRFNTSGSGIPDPYWSVCLSPAGLLDGSTHQYNILPFSAANPGIYPSAWAWGVVGITPQYWGINNAAYLWNKYGMGIVNNTGSIGYQNQRAAALEFAVWTALYNSMGYGQLGGSAWSAPTGQMGSATRHDSTLYWYNTYLNALTTSGLNHAVYTGNVLESTIADSPNNPNSGGSQEFLLLGTPVPEPATMVAGALLLLPFAASTLRFVRRNRAA
jgi:hypothetical protein